MTGGAEGGGGSGWGGRGRARAPRERHGVGITGLAVESKKAIGTCKRAARAASAGPHDSTERGERWGVQRERGGLCARG